MMLWRLTYRDSMGKKVREFYHKYDAAMLAREHLARKGMFDILLHYVGRMSDGGGQ